MIATPMCAREDEIQGPTAREGQHQALLKSLPIRPALSRFTALSSAARPGYMDVKPLPFAPPIFQTFCGRMDSCTGSEQLWQYDTNNGKSCLSFASLKIVHNIDWFTVFREWSASLFRASTKDVVVCAQASHCFACSPLGRHVTRYRTAVGHTARHSLCAHSVRDGLAQDLRRSQDLPGGSH